MGHFTAEARANFRHEILRLLKAASRADPMPDGKEWEEIASQWLDALYMRDQGPKVWKRYGVITGEEAAAAQGFHDLISGSEADPRKMAAAARTALQAFNDPGPG